MLVQVSAKLQAAFWLGFGCPLLIHGGSKGLSILRVRALCIAFEGPAQCNLEHRVQCRECPAPSNLSKPKVGRFCTRRMYQPINYRPGLSWPNTGYRSKV